ncbi:IclR family transcriptional regulator [Clostridium beijerinckii]|uniref:IclR family transcriptional regulator n=1 Tax=Clostridium beijerinckii TaxID=1520 RepID=A0A0B5QGZ3_CLOBE|nr:IclR family transcriptional regulator [Clostridium beijerinckii]AJH00181.1 IclR family transcriptional regulator [Clostridium beijerinckii]
MDNTKENKSAARVVDLLVLLAHSDAPLALNEICHAQGWPKSSAFELIQTLVNKGLLEIKDERLKTYGLSLLSFEVGSSYLSNLGITDQARPYIQQLNKQTGSTVFLGIEDNGAVVYLDKAETYSFMKPTAKLGARRYLHTTGVGKALLAAYPEEKIKKILSKNPLFNKTEFSNTTLDSVLQDMREIKSRGYSIDNREDNTEMYCMGAAIYNQLGNPVASISVASLYNSMSEERKNSISTALTETAMQISRKLGYTGSKLYMPYKEINEH